MAGRNVLLLVDGREVVVPRESLDGMTILAAVGAAVRRRDVLVRDDGGRARVVGPSEPVDIVDGPLATFRVHRGGHVRLVEVDGCVWGWGASAIGEYDIREIAGIPDDGTLFLASGDGDPIPPGVLIDLNAKTATVINSRAG